jgi:hypothetical protein
VGYFALAIAYAPEPENSRSALSKAYAIVYNEEWRCLPEESTIVFKWLGCFDGGCLFFARSFRSGHLLIDWA